MIIRPEEPKDRDAIEAVILAAFRDHPYSRQTEQLILRELRQAGAMPASLVAETDGELVGQIAFSPVLIGGKDCGWVGMGPVSVRPGLQRKGIGSRLVRAGLDEMRRQGKKGCLLVGDPAFYARFGFKQAKGLTLAGVPPEVFQALSFDGTMPSGPATFHPAFMAGL